MKVNPNSVSELPKQAGLTNGESGKTEENSDSSGFLSRLSALLFGAGETSAGGGKTTKTTESKVAEPNPSGAAEVSGTPGSEPDAAENSAKMAESKTAVNHQSAALSVQATELPTPDGSDGKMALPDESDTDSGHTSQKIMQDGNDILSRLQQANKALAGIQPSDGTADGNTLPQENAPDRSDVGVSSSDQTVPAGSVTVSVTPAKSAGSESQAPQTQSSTVVSELAEGAVHQTIHKPGEPESSDGSEGEQPQTTAANARHTANKAKVSDVQVSDVQVSDVQVSDAQKAAVLTASAGGAADDKAHGAKNASGSAPVSAESELDKALGAVSPLAWVTTEQPAGTVTGTDSGNGSDGEQKPGKEESGAKSLADKARMMSAAQQVVSAAVSAADKAHATPAQVGTTQAVTAQGNGDSPPMPTPSPVQNPVNAAALAAANFAAQQPLQPAGQDKAFPLTGKRTEGIATEGKEAGLAHQIAAASGQPATGQVGLIKTEAPQPQPPLHLNRDSGPDELAEKVNMMMSKNLKNIDIRLDPPELGRMHIRMNMNGDSGTTVHFTVASQHARDALEHTMPRLREMLHQQGVQLGETSVQQQNSGQQYAAGRQQNGGDHSGPGIGAAPDTEAGEGGVSVDTRVTRSQDGISYYA